MSERLDSIVAARQRAQTLARLRAMAQAGATTRPGGPVKSVERCDLCSTTIPDDHRHLLHLVERQIVCACEACWARHSGDPEFRPTGMRTVWLEDFRCDEEMWGRFEIPIGLAFFMRSSVSHGLVAFYPSPAGATESELDLRAWEELCTTNPLLADLEPDAEALVVNRMTQPHQYAIAPIDQCYALVGLIKSRWEGISGGAALEEAVPAFFESLRARTNAGAGARR